MKAIDDALDRVDRYQRGRRWLAFPLAVVKKFGDDKAGYLAALIAHYGFFSFFLLLMVFVSVLGVVLRGNPGLARTIVSSVLGQFPVFRRLLRTHSLPGGGLV